MDKKWSSKQKKVIPESRNVNFNRKTHMGQPHNLVTLYQTLGIVRHVAISLKPPKTIIKLQINKAPFKKSEPSVCHFIWTKALIEYHLLRDRKKPTWV